MATFRRSSAVARGIPEWLPDQKKEREEKERRKLHTRYANKKATTLFSHEKICIVAFFLLSLRLAGIFLA
jgi:hypothetical protein